MPPQIPMNRTRMLTMTHKTLQQSREAENALADALVSSTHSSLVRQLFRFLESKPLITVCPQRSPGRKNYSSKSFDDQSDNESETSSVCSERSFDSFRRNDVSLISPVLKATIY